MEKYNKISGKTISATNNAAKRAIKSATKGAQ